MFKDSRDIGNRFFLILRFRLHLTKYDGETLITDRSEEISATQCETDKTTSKSLKLFNK